MNKAPVNCQNCEENHDGNFEFCPHCGQKSNEELTLSVLFYNTISNYFSFDARFLKSFLPLMIKPGHIAKAFINGKRLLYLHPAQMYLFVAVIFFFISNFYVREGREELDKNMQKVLANRNEKVADSINTAPKDSISGEALFNSIKDNNAIIGLNDDDLKVLDSLSKTKIKSNIDKNSIFEFQKIDSLIAVGASNSTIYKSVGMDESAGYFTKRFYAQALKFYKNMGAGQIFQTFIDSIPLAMFFLLPIFAFLLKLFYFNKGKYAHHLVFSFYYFSFLFTVFSFVFGVNRWVIDIPDPIDWLIALSTFFYLYLAIIRFYGQGWFLSFIKSGIVSFLFLLIVLPTSVAFLAFIAFLFY